VVFEVMVYMPQSDLAHEVKECVDILGRLAIIGIVIWVEWGLLTELKTDGTDDADDSISASLLAAIVIIAALLILGLAAFKGSLEQDVSKLETDFEKFQTDFGKLQADFGKSQEALKDLKSKVK